MTKVYTRSSGKSGGSLDITCAHGLHLGSVITVGQETVKVCGDGGGDSTDFCHIVKSVSVVFSGCGTANHTIFSGSESHSL